MTDNKKTPLRARAMLIAAAGTVAVLSLTAGAIAIDHFLDRRASDAATRHAESLVRGDPAARQALEAVASELAASRQRALTRRVLIVGAGGTVLLVFALLLAARVAREAEAYPERVRRAAYKFAVGDWSQPIVADDGDESVAQALESIRERAVEREAAARWLDGVLDSMADAVFVTSPSGAIRRVNNAATRLTGWSAQELLGRSIVSVVAPQDQTGFDVDAASQQTRELTFATRAGQVIPVSLSGSQMAMEDPGSTGCIFVARDITDRKRAERRIRYLARYDTLTKVPNRMQFQHSLQQAIARARRSRRTLALLYLDLDQFKEVNDTFGHAAGDRTLEILSERLISMLPKETMLGRLAGDEFGLFVENLSVDEDNRPAVGALARELLEHLAKPFHLATQEVVITASIGIAFCPNDADNVVDLIRDADAAMYHSKQNGGNSVSFFSPEMSAVAVERLMLKSKLRRAIERDELVMLYQPKVDLRDGRVVGAEALLRWRLPAHGDIPPSQFIPLAEESHLINEIGEWVLKRVCRDYRRWQDHVPQPGRVSINLSLKQLKQAEFIPRCRSVFDDFGVSPTNFELEITETTLMTDARRMLSLLDQLRAMGVHLAIDDFGTGYSSLAALQQFPVGTLKIDKSFVRHAAATKEDATLVRTIIEMGRNLGLVVVAEGVETPAQLRYLRERNCHVGQGKLFGEAMEADALLKMLLDQASGERRFAEYFG